MVSLVIGAVLGFLVFQGRIISLQGSVVELKEKCEALERKCSGMANEYAASYTDAYKDGHAHGYETGYADGKEYGAEEAVIIASNSIWKYQGRIFNAATYRDYERILNLTFIDSEDIAAGSW